MRSGEMPEYDDRTTCGERYALVEAEQRAVTPAELFRRRPVLDDHDDVVHRVAELGRYRVERVGDHLFEVVAVAVTATGEFCPLISRGSHPYDAHAGVSRCGKRVERDHPRATREPGPRSRSKSRGDPGGASAGGAARRRRQSARGRQAMWPSGHRPRKRPRGDPSCDAAETTRGLPRSGLFASRSGVVPPGTVRRVEQRAGARPPPRPRRNPA